MGIPFNLIDSQIGEKADLIPASRSDSDAFQRRVRQTIILPLLAPLEIWCASVEDIILGKLEAWAQVNSRKHERDILEMLVVALDQTQDTASLDISYIDRKAININVEAYNLWQSLLKRAQNS